MLPTGTTTTCAWIARSLELSPTPAPARCSTGSASIREFVAKEFDALLHDGRARAANGNGGCRGCGTAPQPIDREQLRSSSCRAELGARVRRLAEQPRVRLLRDETQLRLARLVARAAQAVAEAALHAAAPRCCFVDWLEPLLRRESYLALLAERPEVHEPAAAPARRWRAGRCAT